MSDLFLGFIPARHRVVKPVTKPGKAHKHRDRRIAMLRKRLREADASADEWCRVADRLGAENQRLRGIIASIRRDLATFQGATAYRNTSDTNPEQKWLNTYRDAETFCEKYRCWGADLD